MPFITWTNQLSVDVKLLDNDHKKLAILINDLHDGLMTGHSTEALQGIFDQLVEYSRIHFVHEERFLDEAGYSGAAAHKQEHDHKIEQVLDLQARFRRETGLAGLLEVMDMLKDWLFVHIQRSDQEFVEHLKATGVESILAGWNEPDWDAGERPASGPEPRPGPEPA